MVVAVQNLVLFFLLCINNIVMLFLIQFRMQTGATELEMRGRCTAGQNISNRLEILSKTWTSLLFPFAFPFFYFFLFSYIDFSSINIF